MAGTMLAQQMLSFEKRHSIQPPSLTHAHELRASIGTKRRLANEESFPSRSRSRSSPGRPSSLPELSKGGSPSKRDSPLGNARRKARGSSKKRGGRGARSLVKLEEMRETGELSSEDHKKAAAAVQETVGGAASPAPELGEPAATPVDEVEDDPDLDAAVVAAERRDILTPMTPSRHGRAQGTAAEVLEEDVAGAAAGADGKQEPMSLFGVYANMPLLDALAKGGEGVGYRRPDTAEIIGDPDDLPPLTTRMSSMDGFNVSPPNPKVKRSLGMGALIAREAEESVRPQDFVDDDTMSEDSADADEDVDASRSTETQREKFTRERVHAARQLARAPSRGEKFHSEALTANNFGLIGPGTERRLWWQKPEDEAVTSEEVPEQLAVPPEPNMTEWKGGAAAAGPDLFFGSSARQAFFDLTKSQHREWNAEGIPDEDGEGGGPDSGRRHYLRECELTHKIPQALLVHHGNKPSKVVDLSYRRLGNTTGSAYAGALLKAAAQQGVEIEELRLRENNLTTRGIVAMAATIHSCPLLRVIDLSSNEFSEQGSESLAKALEHHPLIQQITMSNCSIEDKDGAYLIEALAQNSSITYLDLSRNQLGAGAGAWCRDQECPATLHSDSSATAKLAKMLGTSSPAMINTLNLSYNSLSSRHFQLMASSLKHNKTLQHLDLSWNTCGDDGAMALADALRPNKSLLSLDLTRTAIGERGAMVIADVLKENQGLEIVKLNENPIGERGGRAILRALRKILQYGWTREITVARSNFQLVDESQKGTTRYVWVDDPSDHGETGTKRKILQYDRDQPLFDPADAGGHHKCDLEDAYQRMVAWELVELAWTEEGENWSDEKIDGAVFELDEPGPGEIWQRADHPTLPDSGMLEVNYTNTPRVPRFKDVLEPAMLIRLLEMMTQKEVTDHGMNLLRLAAQEFWFTAQYVGMLLKMQKDGESRVMAITALYPRIVDIANVQFHVLDYLTKSEVRKLESNLGILLHFMPTNPTGHYKLDLINPYHRIIKQKLVEIAKEEKDFRRHNVANQGGSMIDTSQHGDWENFRNETLNKEKYDFDTSNAASGSEELKPPAILEFDYVSTSVAHRLLNLPPMTHEVFELFLLDLFRVRHYVDIVDNFSKRGKKSKKKSQPSAQQGSDEASLNDTQNSGFLAGSSSDLNDTQEIDYADAEPEGEPEPEPGPESEFANFGGAPLVGAKKKKKKAAAALDSFGEEEQAFVQLIQALWRGKMVRRVSAAKQRASDALKARQLELESLAQASQQGRQEDMSGPGTNGKYMGRDVFSVIQEIISKGQKKALKRKVRNCWWISTQHKKTVEMTKKGRLRTIAKRQLTMLRRCTAQWYFSVAQCNRILEAIPEAFHVEAIVIMFSRITDIENLDVSSMLGHTTFDKDGNGWITEDELAELKSASSSDVCTQRYLQVCHRIGHANLFNPLFPESEYALNLKDWGELPPSESHPHGDKKGHHDQRRVAECLIVLSAEPGDNTVNETYNGMYFEVENRWEDGVPHVGMFCTTYTTRRHGGALMLRLPLCRALLAPGAGRYKKTLELRPLNARALEAIGNDEKLLTKYRNAADCEDPRAELTALIISAELGPGGSGGNVGNVIATEKALRKELAALEMNAIQHQARHDAPGHGSGDTEVHTKNASYWKSEIFDATENPEEFDEQVQDWEKDWMLDADGEQPAVCCI
jgi:Ran GTPase-activating protein (RanGAP) involved in mRNA processing and transport